MEKQTQNRVKSLALASLVGLSTLATNVRAEGIHGNVGYIQREESKDSYAEINAFYKLPLDVRGFTFLDWNNETETYFGKTTLTRAIADTGISARAQIVHVNELSTETGLGLEAKLPTPKGITAKVNCMPYWRNNCGEEKNTVKVGYFVSADLPYNMTLSSFGEANVANPQGITWAYGEVELAKKIGDLSIGYNASLNCQGVGKVTPEIRHGIAVRYNF
jgi:hypothetical protein